jgi:hypothetical protein
MDATAESSPSNRRRERWIIALLIFVALIPFIRAVFFPYVYDDRAIIRTNPDIRGWSSLLTVWGKPYWQGAADAGFYRPAFVALLATVWNLGGHFPIWFHLFAMALHAGATVVVWQMLRRALPTAPATLAALWFAVLPVHIEAVANVANSSEVVVAIWSCLLAVLLARIDRRVPDDRAVSWTAAASVGLVALATFLSKESGVVAPFAAAAWVWGWRAPSPPRRDGWRTVSYGFIGRWWRVVLACAVALVVVLVARRIVLGGFMGAPVAPGLVGLTAWQRVWAMVSLGPLVAEILVWPRTINPEYGPTTLRHFGPSGPAIATLLVLATGTLLAIRNARAGDRRLLAAIAWFAVTFAPASNLVAATPQILTERTLYGPSIALAFVVALILGAVLSGAKGAVEGGRLAAQHRAIRLATAGAMSVLIVATGLKCLELTGAWQSNEAVFRQMVVADSASYRGYWKLAALEKSRNRMDESLALFDRAYRLYPRDRQLLADYTQVLLEQRQPVRAAAVARGLMAWPEVRRMPNIVALYLDALGQAYGADSVIRAGRALFAHDATPTAALFVGAAHESRGDPAAAEASYRAGLRIAPGDTALRRRLAVVGGRRSGDDGRR